MKYMVEVVQIMENGQHERNRYKCVNRAGAVLVAKALLDCDNVFQVSIVEMVAGKEGK